MRLTVFRDDITEGLHKSASIIPAKTGAAFLRTIWLKAEDGALRIMSTDSNLEFSGRYTAEIAEEGLVGVQGRSFHDLVRKLPPGPITLRTEEDGQGLAIEQNARRYKLPTNEKSWFQEIASFPEENALFWSGDFLQEVIGKIDYCLSDQDTEAISCLFMTRSKDGQQIETAGLNGHQFAMFSFANDELAALLPAGGVLVQRRYLAELKKWLVTDEIELSIGDKRLFFRTGDGRETFSLPLSFYQFPDYMTFLSRVTGGEGSRLDVDRLEMIESLERIAIFNTDTNRCAYFDLAPSQLVLSSAGQDVGKASETLEAEFAGDLKRIAFPTRGMIDILSHFSSERVRLTFTGTEGPCGITGAGDPEYIVIVMPMKIVEETYYNEEEASV